MSFQWSPPTKKIVIASDIPRFKRSIGYKNLNLAIEKKKKKIKGIDIPKGYLDPKIVTRELDVTEVAPKLELPAPEKDKSAETNAATNIIQLLNDIDKITDSTPPLTGPRRFGNMASRTWHDKLQGQARGLLVNWVPKPSSLEDNDFSQFLDELQYYFVNSFGSKIRLDYGTGHELSFLAFLGALDRFKVVPFSEIKGVDILIIFARYYDVVRRLIVEYTLEPAGSHGAWGLDDHFHLIYI